MLEGVVLHQPASQFPGLCEIFFNTGLLQHLTLIHAADLIQMEYLYVL